MSFLRIFVESTGRPKAAEGKIKEFDNLGIGKLKQRFVTDVFSAVFTLLMV